MDKRDIVIQIVNREVTGRDAIGYLQHLPRSNNF